MEVDYERIRALSQASKEVVAQSTDLGQSQLSFERHYRNGQPLLHPDVEGPPGTHSWKLPTSGHPETAMMRRGNSAAVLSHQVWPEWTREPS